MRDGHHRSSSDPHLCMWRLRSRLDHAPDTPTHRHLQNHKGRLRLCTDQCGAGDRTRAIGHRGEPASQGGEPPAGGIIRLSQYGRRKVQTVLVRDPVAAGFLLWRIDGTRGVLTRDTRSRARLATRQLVPHRLQLVPTAHPPASLTARTTHFGWRVGGQRPLPSCRSVGCPPFCPSANYIQRMLLAAEHACRRTLAAELESR